MGGRTGRMGGYGREATDGMSAAATGRGAKGAGSVAAGRTGRAPWGDGRMGGYGGYFTR